MNGAAEQCHRVEGHVAAHGPTYGGIDGCFFRLEEWPDGEEEWQILGGPQTAVVVHGGSAPLILVDGEQSAVIPEPYGHVLALRDPLMQVIGLTEVAKLDEGTSLTGATLVGHQEGGRVVTLTVGPSGWLVRKTVEMDGDLIDELVVTDFVDSRSRPRITTLRPRFGSWSMSSEPSCEGL